MSDIQLGGGSPKELSDNAWVKLAHLMGNRGCCVNALLRRARHCHDDYVQIMTSIGIRITPKIAVCEGTPGCASTQLSPGNMGGNAIGVEKAGPFDQQMHLTKFINAYDVRRAQHDLAHVGECIDLFCGRLIDVRGANSGLCFAERTLWTTPPPSGRVDRSPLVPPKTRDAVEASTSQRSPPRNRRQHRKDTGASIALFVLNKLRNIDCRPNSDFFAPLMIVPHRR